MKKKSMNAFLHGRKVKKWFLMMKLTMLLFLAGLMQVSATVYSQATKFNFRAENKQVVDVLKEIEESSDFRFFYIREQVDVERKVTVRANGATVEQILDELFAGHDISYKVMDDNLVLLSPNENIRDIESVSSQQNSVSGKVTDTSNQPLPGVTVVVKGTTNGTVTNADGDYTLSNVQEVAVLQFSFVGMKMQEVTVGNQVSISIIMEEETIGLEEVVAIGYGTQKKSDLTGSVASVSSNEIRKQPVVSLGQAIQGRASGVVVSSNTGAPGGNLKIRIRGANSMLGSNEPLYIVDGVALNVSINDLNVNDIESIEVLKDASSTAVYGSRGANGVIMITTKRGKNEITKVQLTMNTGISKLARKYDLLDAGSFAELVNVYKPNYFTTAQIADYKTNGGIDWQDEVFQTGISQDYQISLSGGASTTKFYISGNYIDQKGIVTGADLAKYSIRSNLTTQLGKKLKFDMNLYASRLNTINTADNGSKGAPLWNTPLFPPTFPIYNASGGWNRTDNLSGPGLMNPLMVLKERYSDYLSNSIVANTKLSYDIFEDLKLDIVFGVDNNSGQNGSITNEKMNPTTTAASLSENKSFTWQNSNILTYTKKIGGAHDLTAMVASESSKFDYSGFGASGTSIYPISVGYDNLGISNGKNLSSYRSQYSLQSYLGRIFYSYMNKYLITATYRADGTSKFQGDNKWGYFPATALAWRVSEESFMKGQDIISNLKLRGSWGITGNQGINAYATIAKIGSMANSFGLANMVPGSIVAGADNPDLKWETTAQTNIGLDVSAFKGRINISADYYVKNTSDLLNYAAIPKYNGGGGVNKNIGEMENKGYEIALSGTPVSKNDFEWEASFNISAYKNELLSLGKDTFLLGGNYAPGLTQESPFAIKVGESLGSFWGYEWLGVYNTNEAADAAKYGFKPGDNKYLDYNKDGKIDSKDKHIIGNAMPDFVWGFDNTFSYKNLELNVMLQAVVGKKILNTVYASASTILTDATAISHVDGADYWRIDNENAKFASPTSSTGKNFIESTQYLQDGSYVKFKNIGLAYNLSKEQIKFADLKLTISAQNLYTFTKYKGYDPETSTSGNDIDGAIDVGSYPNARTITFSMQVNF
jgi:TonB-linked SusC/RagA family outer membrane protein